MLNKIAAMIVDDRVFFRAGVRQAIDLENSSGSIDVLECDVGTDGSEATAQIASKSPDVVILDIGYPFRYGLGLCKKIVRTFPSTRVVMLSSNPSEDDDELFETIESGAASYLRSQQCLPEELAETIKQASSGEYPINAIVSSKPKIAWRVLRRFQDMASNVREEDDIVAPLTPREMQILTLIAEGNQNKQIAKILGISEQTIKNHVSSMLRKLNANDRAHAVMLAMRSGLVSVEPDLNWGRRREDTLSNAPDSSMFELN